MFTKETTTHVKIYVWFSFISTFLLVVLAGILRPIGVPFWQLNAYDVTVLFGLLSLVALVIERSVEVIMAAWRGPQKKTLENAIIAAMNLLPKSQVDLDKAKADKEQFSAETRSLTLLTSLVLGILVGVLGLRVLQPLVDPVVFKSMSTTQISFFTAVDAFLTGALLGGGADGIHNILDTFLKWVRKHREIIKIDIAGLQSGKKQ